MIAGGAERDRTADLVNAIDEPLTFPDFSHISLLVNLCRVVRALATSVATMQVI
jgi:hypothetical protein